MIRPDLRQRVPVDRREEVSDLRTDVPGTIVPNVDENGPLN